MWGIIYDYLCTDVQYVKDVRHKCPLLYLHDSPIHVRRVNNVNLIACLCDELELPYCHCLYYLPLEDKWQYGGVLEGPSVAVQFLASSPSMYGAEVADAVGYKWVGDHNPNDI